MANGGTLFLDEIGDVPMEVQVKLLRVLQSKEFERVGGRETLTSDFRLLAATNRDLKKDIGAKHFREDLFYRLNVFPISIPPLRKRKADIPLLARYFLKIHSDKLGKNTETIFEKDLEKLIRYNWPGNVRELENLIERGIILSSGPVFKMPELDIASPEDAGKNRFLSLEETERLQIIKALERTKGKVRGKDGAAKLLEIHPNTLYSRMKKHGIKKQPASFS
jgi:transcriptional regulator with GAF, ATPase, and Fis domain